MGDRHPGGRVRPDAGGFPTAAANQFPLLSILSRDRSQQRISPWCPAMDCHSNKTNVGGGGPASRRFRGSSKADLDEGAPAPTSPTMRASRPSREFQLALERAWPPFPVHDHPLERQAQRASEADVVKGFDHPTILPEGSPKARPMSRGSTTTTHSPPSADGATLGRSISRAALPLGRIPPEASTPAAPPRRRRSSTTMIKPGASERGAATTAHPLLSRVKAG